MKKIIAMTAMMLGVSAATAQAVDWKQIEKNKFFTGYMDYDTFRFNDEKTAITFWIKNEFTKEGGKQMSSKKPASHSMQRFTANCADETLASLEFHLYGKNKAIMHSESQYEQMSLIPGSVSENTFNVACGILASIRMDEEQQKTGALDSSVTGFYVSDSNSDLTITEQDNDQYKFDFTGIYHGGNGSVNTGELSIFSTLARTINYNSAPDEATCVISINIINNQLINVDQKEGNCGAGMNVFFGGTYKKEKTGKKNED